MSEDMTKVPSSPDIRLVEKKVVKTIEGFKSSLVRSLEPDKELTARQEEEARHTQAYWREQYENQVLLNQQIAAQWKMLEASHAEHARIKADMERLNAELAERPRASSLARWGIFNEKTDEDMEEETKEQTSKDTVKPQAFLSAGADMPIPPVYKGYTQSHKREFMDSYLVYARKVQFINESTTFKVVRMPVGACIDHKTAVRICRYEFNETEDKITEERWKAYFMEASKPDLTRLASLEKALANLKMIEDVDGNSRVDKLLHDFMVVLDENNMESYDLREPKLCIQHLVNAIRPFPLRQTIKASLRSQHTKLYREHLQDFIAWLRPQVVSFSLFEAGLKKSEEYAKKKQTGTDCKGQTRTQGPGPSGSGGTQGAKGRTQPRTSTDGKTAGGKKTDQGKITGDQKSDTQRRCFKCNSTEHSVFNCSEATQDEARHLWETFKKNGMKKTIGGITQLSAPQEDAVFLDADCGKVSLKLLTDFGASESVISSKCVKKLQENNGSLKIRVLNQPVTAVGFSGDYVTIKKEAVLTLQIPTKAGALLLTNVRCWVLPMNLPNGMGDVLLSRKIMQKLGYSPHQLIENARKHYAVLDVTNQDLLEVSQPIQDTPTIGMIGAITPMEPSTTPSIEEEGLEEGVSLQYTPSWSTDKPQEQESVREVLKNKVQDARDVGCPMDIADQLVDLLMEFEDCFRTELGRDPPVDVEPLEVRPKEGVEPVKCKARRYSPEQKKFLEEHVAQLEAAGLVYRNNKSRWASPPLIVPKPNGKSRMTVDVRMVNDRTDRLVWPMPMMETITEHLRGAKVFFTLDFFKGYWQLPLAKESQELFSFITDTGVYTPTRVLMGGSDSVAYCQATVQEMFAELLYKGLLVWLDDLLGYVKDPGSSNTSSNLTLATFRFVLPPASM